MIPTKNYAGKGAACQEARLKALRKGGPMGEPNNALNAYMGRPDRIRSVLEYYIGEKLPEDWSTKVSCAFRCSKVK